jgi:hypothetical protein
MALTLTIKGGKTQLSGNRVAAVVATDATTGTMYNLLLKTTSLDDSFPEGIDLNEPDDDLQAEFDIKNRVTLPIVYSFTWPLTGAVAVEHAQMAKKVALDIGERYVEIVDNENKNYKNWSGLDGEDYQILILKGKVSKHQQAKWNEANTNFYTEFISAGKFLTLLPDNMKISEAQPVKLWFITKETTSQALNLVVNYTNTDETEGSSSIAVTIEPDKMTELCVDLPSLGLDPSGIDSYSVQLEKDGIGVGEIRNFTLDHNYYENNTYVLYANKVGGIDCVWFTGAITKFFPTESTRSQRDARSTDTQQRPTVAVDYNHGIRKWEINTGNKSRDEMEALSDLFESRSRWILDGNDIIPVYMADDDNEFDYSQDNNHSMELTFTEAH